ncbi:MAG TPA: hypothetical protein DCG73_00025 [Morganella sp. (in: Bacteria)]|nr:hypothetical protein [Morganella sp. (in: enterobacteria)]
MVSGEIFTGSIISQACGIVVVTNLSKGESSPGRKQENGMFLSSATDGRHRTGQAGNNALLKHVAPSSIITLFCLIISVHGKSASARQLPANALHNTKVADMINGLKTGNVI